MRLTFRNVTDNELVTYMFFTKIVQQSTKKTVPPNIVLWISRLININLPLFFSTKKSTKLYI